MTDIKTDDEDAGVLVFSSTVAKQLVQDRFPTTYVGVRRLRPSNRVVALAAAGKVEKQTTSDVVYKVIDQETGEERRMTSREKKDYKQQQKLQKQEEKKRKREEMERSATIGVDASRESVDPVQEDQEKIVEESLIETTPEDSGLSNQGRYMQLKIDPTSLADEISDLRGEREGVPPVFIPPPIVRLFSSAERLSVNLDDDWAATWASNLQAAFQPAEETRQKESMRPMPYRVIPEVWSRMRPAEMGTTMEVTSPAATIIEKGLLQPAKIRPVPLDTHSAAVLQLLHVGTGLHLSCGAKFGCDFLMYDGPRSERHAFAGLRMISSDNPFPSAYDLAGYVRTLNTAGKLALLACVKKEKEQYQVAIIDLALVKIAQTTFHKPRKTMEDRLKNLAKK